MKQQRRPLEGIRIVDLTQVQFGPSATQMLADFGAEVIKIERPGLGDISRTYDPYIEDGGESAYFMSLNRNKKSIVLDLRLEEARAVAMRLVEGADVLVHNFRPGVAERIGLGYEELKQNYPRLIYASGSGFGVEGPLVHKGGQDLLAQSLSGIASRNIDSEGRPQLFPVACGDYSAGMLLAQGILLALFDRERTGVGRSLHVSLLDTLVAMQMQEATQWLLRQRPTNWVRQALVGTFMTSDGAISVVGVFRPNPLADICRALGIEDLSLRPEYRDERHQVENKTALWKELEPCFERLTSAEALDRLDREDVLCAPILSLDDALNQEQLVANSLLIDFEHPIHGRVRTVGCPIKMSGVGGMEHAAPPLHGQHTREILAVLGYSAEQIEAMFSAGVASSSAQTGSEAAA